MQRKVDQLSEAHHCKKVDAFPFQERMEDRNVQLAKMLYGPGYKVLGRYTDIPQRGAERIMFGAPIQHPSGFSNSTLWKMLV